jgi:hypothetical protein
MPRIEVKQYHWHAQHKATFSLYQDSGAGQAGSAAPFNIQWPQAAIIDLGFLLSKDYESTAMDIVTTSRRITSAFNLKRNTNIGRQLVQNCSISELVQNCSRSKQ